MAELLANPPVVELLEALCGEDIVFTRGLFTRTLAGSPPISLHTDGQPFGSSIFGYEGSSPRLLRVLYYLDDLTPERAPLRVLPRSHLSFHADANPYVRYKSHPGEVTLCASAGTAVLFPVNIFHGTHPNRDDSLRTLIQFGYRPAWAGPIQPMEEWDPELVAAAPAVARRFLQSLNTSGVDWEQPQQAPGHEVGRAGHRSRAMGTGEPSTGRPCTDPETSGAASAPNGPHRLRRESRPLPGGRAGPPRRGDHGRSRPAPRPDGPGSLRRRFPDPGGVPSTSCSTPPPKPSTPSSFAPPPRHGPP